MFTLVVVLLLALGVRLYVVDRAQNIARDGTIYLTMAKQFGAQPAKLVCKEFQYHPGYSAIVAAIARLTDARWPDGYVQIGQGVAIGFGMLLLVMLYVFARLAFDHKIAIVTILLAGLAQAITEVTSDVLSDAPAVALAMTGIVLGTLAERQLLTRTPLAILLAGAAGLAAGMAYLCRPEGLLAAVLAGALLLRNAGPGPSTARLRIFSIAALILGAAICVLPYYVTIGAFTQKKSLNTLGLLQGADVLLASLPSWPMHLVYSFEHILDKLRAGTGNPIAFLALATIVTHLLGTFRRRGLPAAVDVRPTPSASLVMWIGCGVMMIVLTKLEMTYTEKPHDHYVAARQMLLPVMLLAPLAGAGVFIVAGWVSILASRISPGLGRPSTLAVLTLLVFTILISYHALFIPHNGKACFKQAGLDILKTQGPNHFFLATDCWVPFWAGAPVEQFSTGTFSLSASDMSSYQKLRARITADRNRARDKNVILPAASFLVLPKTVPQEVLNELSNDPQFQMLSPPGQSGGGATWTSDDETVWIFQLVSRA